MLPGLVRYSGLELELRDESELSVLSAKLEQNIEIASLITLERNTISFVIRNIYSK